MTKATTADHFIYDATYRTTNTKHLLTIDNGHPEHKDMSVCPYFRKWQHLKEVHAHSGRTKIDPCFQSFMAFKAWVEKEQAPGRDISEYVLAGVSKTLVPTDVTGPEGFVLVLKKNQTIFKHRHRTHNRAKRRKGVIRDPFRLLDAPVAKSEEPAETTLPRWVCAGKKGYTAQAHVLGLVLTRTPFDTPLEAHLCALQFVYDRSLSRLDEEMERTKRMGQLALREMKRCLEEKCIYVLE